MGLGITEKMGLEMEFGPKKTGKWDLGKAWAVKWDLPSPLQDHLLCNVFFVKLIIIIIIIIIIMNLFMARYTPATFNLLPSRNTHIHVLRQYYEFTDKVTSAAGRALHRYRTRGESWVRICSSLNLFRPFLVSHPHKSRRCDLSYI